jgi:endonuclease/exonuclease/phosphatase family metal-dependent hydrolase
VSHWSDETLTQTVAHLTPVSLDERQAILAGPVDNTNHRAHFDRLPALRQIEIGGAPPRRSAVDGPARVVFWNTERLRHIDAITATLKSLAPDVALLCEIDRGMARTQNTDRMVDIAQRLGQSYLYAVEFVELGLGDRYEQRDHAGEHNEQGFHGAGLVSEVSLNRPFLIRLEDTGKWFDGAFEERRVGSTIAIGASVIVAGKPVLMVNAHLESHADPAMRGHDMENLLRRIDLFAPGAPVILGGDFNTSTTGVEERRNREAWLQQLVEQPDRLTSPEPYEPLFAAATAHGYQWQTANIMGQPTQRFPVGSPRPNHKLDWFFTRGLICTDAALIPAVQPNGEPSSDHECLAVTVTPE